MPDVLKTVGRYEILREVGRGGMATVYLARQTDLDRFVALKELGAFHASDPSFAQRFVRESRVAGSLSHPNIVTVHDYFDHEGTPYIAMEYVERGSLRPYVGRLSLAQVGGVLEGLLAGLTHAEAHGIVHRDLKPENLMVTADGRVKIADFGIAKATTNMQTGAFLTATGTTVGTPTYMAPEQAMAQDIGPWTDLYSVGCMAFELFTGRVPFHDSDAPMAILLRHVNEPIPPVTSIVPDVDPRISSWIEALLVKDPAARTRSAEDAWEDFEETLIEQLGPRWRREARLREETTTQPEKSTAPKPLTPAPFEGTSAGGAVSEEFKSFAWGQESGAPDAAPPMYTPPPSAATPAIPEPVTGPPTPLPPSKAVPSDQTGFVTFGAPAPPPPSDVLVSPSDGAGAAAPPSDGAGAAPASGASAAPASGGAVVPPSAAPASGGASAAPASGAAAAPPSGAPASGGASAAPASGAAAAPASAAPTSGGAAATAPGDGAPASPAAGAAAAARAGSAPAADPAASGAGAPAAGDEVVGADGVVHKRGFDTFIAPPPSKPPTGKTGVADSAPAPAPSAPEPAAARTPDRAAAAGGAGAETVMPRALREPPPAAEPPKREAPPAAGEPGGRKWIFPAALAGGVVVAALIGFAASGSGSTTPQPSLVPVKAASGAGVSLKVPAAWRKPAQPATVPGIEAGGSMAGTGGSVVFGKADDSAANSTLLADATRSAAGTLPQRRAVDLGGGLQAYRYDAVNVGGGRKATLYAVPTSQGVATLACVPSAGAGSAAFASACEGIATTLRLTGGTPFPVGPSTSYASSLSHALGTLDTRQTAAEHALKTAKTRLAQAQATDRLQSAYAGAAGTLGKLDLSPADTLANGQLVSALKGTASAYGKAAAAARRKDRAGYHSDSAKAISAQKGVAAALAALQQAGYKEASS